MTLCVLGAGPKKAHLLKASSSVARPTIIHPTIVVALVQVATRTSTVLMLKVASKCVFCEIGTKINEMCSNSCVSRSQPCLNLGPCAFGMFTQIVGSGDSWCRTPWGNP